jgi:quinolinate synthase
MTTPLEELRKDFIILSHNYQIPEIQDAADFVGDSLGLCRAAAKVDKPYILFCGVDFMAESAAMLNPDKTVVVPNFSARCPMAAMLPAKKVREAKKKHPDAAVVLYINTLAEARAEADILCTSANAVSIVNSIKEEKILFGPDKNLAWHVSRYTEKEIIPVPYYGHCRTHVFIKKEHVLKAKRMHPKAEVLIHPECYPEVQLLADHVCSTEQMINQARKSQTREFIVGTEVGLLHRLKKENPEKKFYPVLDKAVCITMKKNTWKKFILALKERKNIVKVDPEIAEKARRALDKMLKLSSRESPLNPVPEKLRKNFEDSKRHYY